LNSLPFCGYPSFYSFGFTHGIALRAWHMMMVKSAVVNGWAFLQLLYNSRASITDDDFEQMMLDG
jgi:hypothetical protein